tara:strand:+ start:3210 stop:4475 length:1266 start_codon:yes stop_codon:yes gene_type:complete
MQKLIVKGGKALSGTISISGSKNATLPILAASILSDKKIILKNVPMVKDVSTMANLLVSLGSSLKIKKKNCTIEIQNKKKLKSFASYQLLKTMRAGVLVLGPLLAKFKNAKISLPGGCAIGSRPVNLHLNALKEMGAKIKIKDGYILATASNGLKGAVIRLPKISVGATENILIAACYAKGKTILKNCACEPEIKDLSKFLVSMGCKIKWKKKRTVEILGVKKFKFVKYHIMFDRIEAGTFIIASALTKGNTIIKNVNHKIMSSELSALKKMGVKIDKYKNKLLIKPSNKIKNINISTGPYPGFPTDLQAQIMVLMSMAKGESKITENIFENRFMHAPELNRMGANIIIKSNKAKINGVEYLNGAEVMATDLRASVSLVLAGLIAKGKTIINRIYHLDRGYEKLEQKFFKCGVFVKRLRNE